MAALRTAIINDGESPGQRNYVLEFSGFWSLAEFESCLPDFEGPDPGLKRRAWNPELCRRPLGSGDPTSAVGQRGLDYFSLSPGLAFHRPGHLDRRWRLRRFLRKPRFIDRKDIIGADNQGP